MRTKRRGAALAAAAAALLLAACGGNPDVYTDEFERVTTIDGPADTSYDLAENIGVRWWIESLVGKTPPHGVRHRLIVEIYPRPGLPDSAIETVHYDFAADETAASLEVTPIATERCPFYYPNCLKHLTFTVTVEDEALRQHVLTGYRVKVKARSGENQILALAPQEIQRQLSAVDTIVAGAPDPLPRDAPHLGIGVIAATATPFDDLPQGVIVVALTPASPAAAAGIAPGDVLLAVNGEPIRVSADLARIMAGIGAGRAVSLQMKRGDGFYSAKLQL